MTPTQKLDRRILEAVSVRLIKAILLCLSIVNAQNLSAQNRIQGEIAGTWGWPISPEGFSRTLNSGAGAHAALIIPLKPTLSLFAEGGFLSYRTDFIELGRALRTPPEAISGYNTYFYNFMIGLRVQPETEPVQVYITAGPGLARITRAETFDDEGPDFDAYSESALAVKLGGGITKPVAKRVDVFVAFDYVHVFTNEQTTATMPVHLGFLIR